MNLKILRLFCALTGIILFSSALELGKEDVGATAAVRYFAENADLFSSSTDSLVLAIENINEDSVSVKHAKQVLLNCRICYKRISFFTAYFFPSETKMYNAAPKYEVEEPELELLEPMGLQQIEALLFDKEPLTQKEELLTQARALNSSVRDLRSLLYKFNANDRQILESLRLEMIRILSLYLSGYDAPLLKSGVLEALQCIESMEVILKPYLQREERKGTKLGELMHQSASYLRSHTDFDAFDRMAYFIKFGLPLQEELGHFIKEENLELNTSKYLNYTAKNIFSRDFLMKWDSVPPLQRARLSAKGKQLFFDKGLSGNQKVSCASCHQPELYFSDGNVKSASLVVGSELKRHTPALLYASFQHTQFWDGRSKTMIEQIKDVVRNPMEMGGHSADLDEIALAINAYLSTLNPLNSAFDRYIQGDKKAMSKDQIRGYNLFMGKAQCGTCHFIPYFNSLVPPFFDISELEVLGTTKDDDLNRPRYDEDMGRFDIYKIQYYQQAFKTPTVRNAQKTFPYMHNGSFKSLESVLDFYNKGGANGVGLKTPYQTLSFKPLNLTKEEINQIIQFINSLTDTI